MKATMLGGKSSRFGFGLDGFDMVFPRKHIYPHDYFSASGNLSLVGCAIFDVVPLLEAGDTWGRAAVVWSYFCNCRI
jgi:hypothetical protein